MKTQTSTIAPLPPQILESKHAGRTFARTSSLSVLEIVTLFDEEIARKAGENLCDRVLAQLGPRYTMRLLPWKLSVTEFPMLTWIVARKAMRSPFLLVTINGKIALAAEVESFFRQCAVALRRGGGALAVQFYGISERQKESSPVHQCLTRIAEESNIPIFSTVVELNHQSRGAGRSSPRCNGSPFVAVSPQTLPVASLHLTHARRPKGA